MVFRGQLKNKLSLWLAAGSLPIAQHGFMLWIILIHVWHYMTSSMPQNASYIKLYETCTLHPWPPHKQNWDMSHDWETFTLFKRCHLCCKNTWSHGFGCATSYDPKSQHLFKGKYTGPLSCFDRKPTENNRFPQISTELSITSEDLRSNSSSCAFRYWHGHPQA
jgi:hypothetical protein